MNMRTHKHWLALIAFLFGLFGVAGCWVDMVRTGEMRTESQSVNLGDAKSVRVELDMGAGEITIGGDATNLLDAKFTYNVSAWKPEVKYEVSGGQGRLRISQPAGTRSNSGNRHNAWDLRLNNKVPMEIKLDMGAGQTELNLGTLSLNRLDVEMGAGEAIVNLIGHWKHDLTARIQGGAGQATVRLPRNVGVHVTAAGGIGSINVGQGLRKEGGAYVNDAYGKSPVTLNVDVQGGVGEIDLELAGPAEPV
jgi:N-terminal domain of toast_rack, DUF2154